MTCRCWGGSGSILRCGRAPIRASRWWSPTRTPPPPMALKGVARSLVRKPRGLTGMKLPLSVAKG